MTAKQKENENNDNGVPAELKKWNWGAFLFTWIWGLKYKVWISLLMFVPIVNIVVWVLLGLKGNEWAWRRSRETSLDSFMAQQRRWKYSGFIALAIVAVFVILFGRNGDTQNTKTLEGTARQSTTDVYTYDSNELTYMVDDYEQWKVIDGNIVFNIEFKNKTTEWLERDAVVEGILVTKNHNKEIYCTWIDKYDKKRSCLFSARGDGNLTWSLQGLNQDNMLEPKGRGKMRVVMEYARNYLVDILGEDEKGLEGAKNMDIAVGNNWLPQVNREELLKWFVRPLKNI